MSLRAASAGVDTWAPAWRVEPESALGRQLEERASVPSAAGGRLVPEKIGLHRVLYWPASGLLKAEGHPNESGLAPVRSLPAALDRLIGSLSDAGIEPPRAAEDAPFRRHRESLGFVGLRRLDLTVDVRADDTDEGRQLLRAFEAAARSSGRFAPVYRRPGKPGDTVYVAGLRGMEGRWYDKGAESGSAPPYRLLRPEAQWRFAGDAAPALSELGDVGWMRERFAKRWGPWARGRIVVGSMSDLGRELARAVRTQRLTPGEARRIAGYLVMEPHGLDGTPSRTRQRLRAEASRFGFHLADGVIEPLEVDLGAALAEAERADLWESGAVGYVEKPDEEHGELRAEMMRQLDERRPQVDGPRPARPAGNPNDAG